MRPDDEPWAGAAADELSAGGRDIPLTDLFLALGATFLFALFLTDPALRLRPAAAPDALRDLLAGRAEIAGEEALVILAEASGVRLPGAVPLEVPLAALARDGALAERLAAGRQPLVLAILPGGEEASFLLDPVIAAGAPARRLLQVRLDPGCAALAPPQRARCRTLLAGSPAP